MLGAFSLGKWPSRTNEPEEIGVWLDASDPDQAASIIIVDGYALWYCSGLNEEARMVEVDLAEPKPGEHPGLMLCDDRYVSQRLYLGDALKVYRDGKAHPNKGPRFWTGKGWVNKLSEPIPGPTPRIIERPVAAEALAPEQRVSIRNGRVYRA